MLKKLVSVVPILNNCLKKNVLTLLNMSQLIVFTLTANQSVLSHLGSVFDSEDELSTEWEELSPTDEQLQENNEFCTSNATPSYPSSVTDTVLDSVHNPNSKLHYTQLSAEAVAKSLLQKFANQKHPAAWELQWLVSFQDAPQSLLPLPDTVAVAPDDILQVEALENKLMSRQNSLPVSTKSSITKVSF